MAIIIYNKHREYAAIQEIPKCASDFIKQVLKHNDISYMQTNILRQYNPPCSDIQREVMGSRSSHCIPCQDRLYLMTQKANRLCFVRHPLSWLLSWWSYKVEWDGTRLQGRSWRDSSPFDNKCRSNDFHEFIAKYLEHYPNGIVSHFFFSYAKECEQMGKVEDIGTGLKDWLEYQRGNKINIDIEKSNTSKDYGVKYTKKEADTIMEREARLTEMGYAYYPEGIVE